jgi:hypothetical protein
VSDISGSRVNEVEAPDDVPVNRILAVLVERLNLPLNSPDGQLMSYKLHHRRTGSQLLDLQTLGQSGVVSGDELRLQPEITAGALNRSGPPVRHPPEAPSVGKRSRRPWGI